MKFAWLPIIVTLLLALPVHHAFATADPDDMVSESVARLGLQTEMPAPKSGPQIGLPAPQSGPQTGMPGPQAETPPPESKPPRIDPPNPSVDRPDVRAPDSESNSQAVPGVIRFLLWGAVIVGTAVIVWSLRDSLPVLGRSRKIVALDPVPPSPPVSTPMGEAQLEADDLARQGRYGEAMHLLLLKSLSELRRQLGTSFAISLTSREILRRVQLSDIGRRSLTSIIRSVERTYFGGEDAGQSDYSDCRANFETLKTSLAAADAV